MNNFLDAMYGTRENIGGNTDTLSIEKNAEAELLADVLKQEGWNTEQIEAMSGDDVMKVAHALFGDNSALLKTASSDEDEAEETPAEEKKEHKDGKKEEEKGEESLEEKLAHADYLGRQMAHAFVDEMSQMEKAAQVEQIKEAKAQELATNLQAQQQPAEDPATKIAQAIQAKLAAPQELTVEQQIEKRAQELAQEYINSQQEPTEDEQKIAQALQLLKEAGVDPFPQA